MIKEGRNVGNTTRLVDAAVQEIFEKGEVVLKDHEMNGTDGMANSRMSDLFEDRMTIEHPHVNVRYYVHQRQHCAKIVE